VAGCPIAENLDSPGRDLARLSGNDVDLHIRACRRVRDTEHGEGARLDCEVGRFASSNRPAVAPMKVSRESLAPPCRADLLCTTRCSPPFEHI
jgi:hypothetical protein